MRFGKHTVIGVFALAVLIACVPANATIVVGLSGLPLGPSTGGVLFTPAGAGYLNAQIGGCLPAATGCTAGNVTGSINGTTWNYTLGAATGSGIVGLNQWQFFGFSSTFDVTDSTDPTSMVTGTIDWSLASYDVADTLNGTVNFTATGTFATLFGASGSGFYTLNLDPLNCEQVPGGTSVSPCNLSTIASSDPIYGYSKIGSAPATGAPEPASLLLLSAGFCGISTVVFRRKRA